MALVYELKIIDHVDRFEFNVDEQSQTISLDDRHQSIEPWSELSFHQCSHCPLTNEQICPVAAQLSHLNSIYQRFKSFDTIEVTLSEDTLTVDKQKNVLTTQVTAQQLLTSMAGLLIAGTQRCQHTQFLFPMARFHHPFSSMEESVYRALANLALIYQFEKISVSFAEFVNYKYKQLSIINRQQIKRMQAQPDGCEALVNGIMNLEMFIQGVLFNLNNDFSELAHLFAAKKDKS